MSVSVACGVAAGLEALPLFDRALSVTESDATQEARAALTGAFDGNEEVEEIEDLLADAVRLAAATGDLSTAQVLAGHVGTLAAGLAIPHRLGNALYCRGLLDHDAARLLAAAERYAEAGRPLLRAKALEAAAGHFIDTGDRTQARAAFTAAVEVYTSLGAAADVARLQAAFRAHGIRRGRMPSTSGRPLLSHSCPISLTDASSARPSNAHQRSYFAVL